MSLYCSCACGSVRLQFACHPVEASICRSTVCKRFHGAGPYHWVSKFRAKDVSIQMASASPSRSGEVPLRYYNVNTGSWEKQAGATDLFFKNSFPPNKRLRLQCDNCGVWLGERGGKTDLFLASSALLNKHQQFCQSDMPFKDCENLLRDELTGVEEISVDSHSEAPPDTRMMSRDFDYAQPVLAPAGFRSTYSSTLGSSQHRNIASMAPNVNTLSSLHQILLLLAPPLDYATHKGQGGRVGVLGGSPDYTGAPYYAGVSSLKVGGELLYLLTCREAAPAIKGYSPELMVSPIFQYHNEAAADPTPELAYRAPSNRMGILNVVKLSQHIYPRLHALCIGPGLGRDRNLLNEVWREARHCTERLDIPVVLDADALFVDDDTGHELCRLIFDLPEFENEVEVNPKKFAPLVLTPNVAEYRNLLRHAKSLLPDRGRSTKSSSGRWSENRSLLENAKRFAGFVASEDQDKADREFEAEFLPRLRGNVICIKKGPMDMIGCRDSSQIYRVGVDIGDPIEAVNVRSKSVAAAGNPYRLINNEGVGSGRSPKTENSSDGAASGVGSANISSKDLTHMVKFPSREYLRGAPRRPGGIGDILSGATATMMGWAKIKKIQPDDFQTHLQAAAAVCSVVRTASFLAYEKKKRSMTAPDVISELGEAFEFLSRF